MGDDGGGCQRVDWVWDPGLEGPWDPGVGRLGDMVPRAPRVLCFVVCLAATSRLVRRWVAS